MEPISNQQSTPDFPFSHVSREQAERAQFELNQARAKVVAALESGAAFTPNQCRLTAEYLLAMDECVRLTIMAIGNTMAGIE